MKRNNNLALFPTSILTLALITIFSTICFAQDEVISVDSEIVVLNATVTDTSGKPFENLQERDFTVFEDGIQQKLAFFETQKTPFAAVILIDTSGSMESRVTLARAAAIKFLAGLRAQDSAAIYNFDSDVSLVQDFSNLRELNYHAFDLKADGMTVLFDAITKAAELLSTRSEKRRAIVVLSDGADTRSRLSSKTALNAAIAANATIYTVDMSSIDTGGGQARAQNRGILKNFAEKTGGKFISTPGGLEMRKAFEFVVEELGSQYTFGYEPSNLKRDGKWRTIEVKLSNQKLSIRTRQGYSMNKK
ncbi:MAG: VWA domain-containing protein [Pyrinomonadaceae bacterium]